MALFDENQSIVPAPRRERSRASIVGLWSVTVAMVVLLVISFLPTAYVIQQPGPVYDTLGTAANADGEQVPLISVNDAETYPTDGSLDLLTVQVVGNRERRPSWFELAMTWFDPSRAAVPIDQIFPPGQTAEQRDQQNAVLMTDSQQEAKAAAFREMGYDVPEHLEVHEVTPDSASQGILEPGDIVRAVDGSAVTDVQQVRDAAAAGEGAPITLSIERAGVAQDVSIAPRRSEVDGQTQWLIGISLMAAFEVPFDVTIQLNNVGGPSAGMMFALGIIDKMTPDPLTGGHRIAGTGTIDADGEVGPIGGIRQKLYGARDAGAEYFLSPSSNCNEVVGHVPTGLRVFSVATLEDSLTALAAIRDGGDLDALPTCTS